MENRFSAKEGGVIAHAAGSQKVRQTVKIVCDMLGRMGIGSDGQYLPAQLHIAPNQILMGIGMAQAVFEAAGVALNPLSFGNQEP